MTGTIFNKNFLFYAALFALWAVFLLVKYHDHSSMDSPVPSAGQEQSPPDATNSAASLQAKVLELRQQLGAASPKTRKSSLLQDLGYVYANLFNATGNSSFRDSAVESMRRASEEEPENSRLHYGLGKFYGATGDPKKALEQYALTLRCDSTYVPALTDAAVCSYISFKESDESLRYAARALRLDRRAPLCHLILGLISLDRKDIDAGRTNLELEIVTDETAVAQGNSSLDPGSIRFAESSAHYRLMLLYCSQIPDRAKASEHLDGYLRLENDPSRKSEAIGIVKKRWGG